MENCFIILELNPDLNDEKVLRTEIRKKQAEWSRWSNTHPDQEIKRKAQQCLDNLNNINEIMLNPDKRMEEARKAKVEIQKIHDSKKMEFENAIELLSKGSITEQAIKNLASKYKKFFYSEKDVREILSRFEVTSTIYYQPNNNKTNELDPTTKKAINDNLKVLREESLYTFLFPKENDKILSTKTLYDKAKKESDSIYRTGAISFENSVKNELIGYCLIIFSSEEKRKKYDQSLSEKKLSPLYEMIDGVCDTGSIEIDHVLHLLDKAIIENIDIDEVLRTIRLKAAKRSIAVNISENLTFKKNITCICKHSNKPLMGKCEKCSTALYYKCSKCNKALTIDSLSCSCGYSLQKVYMDLKLASKNNQEELLMKLWEEGTYVGHPAFLDFADEYKKIREKTDERLKNEKSIEDKISRLLMALNNKNNLEILKSWDESLLLHKPELTKYLSEIKQAHQPTDIKNVEGFHRGSYILIRWESSEFVSQYRVAWTFNSFSKMPGDGEYKDITRGEYDRIGFRIENPLPKDYYITVYSIVSFRGEQLLSKGISEGCKIKISSRNKIRIEYSIKLTGIFKKDGAVLILKTGKNISKIPEFVLVAKPGNILPVDLNSGHVIKSFSGISLIANTVFEQSFNLTGVSFPSRFRLFFIDSSENKNFELVKNPSSKI